MADGRTGKPLVVHVTTAHTASDVRIYERECKSLADTGLFEVVLAAPGTMPVGSTGVRHVPMSEIPSSKLARVSSGWWKAHRAVAGIDGDLFHFHDPELLPLASWMHAKGHTVVWDAHEDYVGRFSPSPLVNGLRRRVPRAINRAGFSALTRFADKGSSGVVAATAGIAARYRNPQTVVVGNEVRLQGFDGVQPSFTNTSVLFTGSPSPGHLFREVVDAVASVPGLDMVVARDKLDPQQSHLAEAKLGDRFKFVGFLNRQALAEQISKSIVGMATYAPNPAYMDPTISPTKLFEFAAAGLPVVGSPVPAVASLIKNSGAGITATGFTSEDLASALRSIVSNEEAWNVASQRGKYWTREEDRWSTSERELIDLYRNLLGISVRMPGE